jgi:hypothetical protein
VSGEVREFVDKLESNQRASRQRILGEIREVARVVGYSVAVHGSEKRDFDLVAVPWTEVADSPEDLVAFLCEELRLIIKPHGEHESIGPIHKPHGRTAYVLFGAAIGTYIDLSVMPPAPSEPREEKT